MFELSLEYTLITTFALSIICNKFSKQDTVTITIGTHRSRGTRDTTLSPDANSLTGIRCTTVSCVWSYSAYSSFYDIEALGWQDEHGYLACEGATRCVTTGRVYSIDRESSSTGVSKVACGLLYAHA